MAERNDVKTLDIGLGLVVNNKVLYMTLNDEVMKYLGTTQEELIEGKEKLVLKFDYADRHKRNFIGIGKKFEK